MLASGLPGRVALLLSNGVTCERSRLRRCGRCAGDVVVSKIRYGIMNAMERQTTFYYDVRSSPRAAQILARADTCLHIFFSSLSDTNFRLTADLPPSWRQSQYVTIIPPDGRQRRCVTVIVPFYVQHL